MSDFLGMFGGARGVRGKQVASTSPGGDRRPGNDRPSRPSAVGIGEVGGD